MSGTISWASDPMPNDELAPWRHRLKGSRLRPRTVAIVTRQRPGEWYGEIDGQMIDRELYPTMREAMHAVERVLIRKGWLASNGKWSAT